MSAIRSLRNRSSRYSSPATFADTKESSAQLPATAEPVHQPQDGRRQSRLDQWVEPVPKAPTASFEEHKGLERVGVLEHMQPLGAPPNQKLLQKLKVTYARPSLSARATPLQSDEVASPVTENAKVEVTSPIERDTLSLPPTQPLPAAQAYEMSPISPPRGRPGKKEAEEMRQIAEEGNMTSSPFKNTSRMNKGSPRQSSIQEHIREEKMRTYVNEAVKKAKEEGRSDIVYGLHYAFDQAKTNSDTLAALEALLNAEDDVSVNHFKIFKRCIKRGVKRHRRNSSLNDYQPLDTSQSEDFPSLNSTTSRLQNTANPSIILRFPNHRHSRSAVSLSNNMPPSPSAVAARPSIEGIGDHNHFTVDSSPKRRRSLSTSSSLSSAKSICNDFNSAEVIEPDEASQGQPIRSAGERQATDRAAARKLPLSSVQRPSPPETTGSFKATNDGAKQRLVLKQKRIAQELVKESRPHLLPEDKVAENRAEFESHLENYNYVEREISEVRQHREGIAEPDILGPVPPLPVVHPFSVKSTTNKEPQSPRSDAGVAIILSDASRKRNFDEFSRDELSPVDQLGRTPTPPPSLAPVAVEGNSGTRSSTPRAAKTQPSAKKLKSARLMISPNKSKNGGIVAGKPGVARAGAGRESVIGTGAEASEEDNEEVCRSCGGEGILICCDGCPNSFHHGCLEPPLDPDTEIEGQWYCPECTAKQANKSYESTGMLSQLIHNVEDTYPRAYALPLSTREYFEGVRTGDEGEYEEFNPPKTQKNNPRMNRAGLIEAQNYKEPRDSKGNIRTCYKCGEMPGGRDLIPCDFCPNEWHLDCLNPPMANPPRRVVDGKSVSTWRCPLHIEDDAKFITKQDGLEDGALGKIPRMRRPREANAVDIGTHQILHNNGIIDVALEKDEMPEVKERDMRHGVLRIPEQRIKLDFIHRVNQKFYEDHAIPREMGLPPAFHEKYYRPSRGSIDPPSEAAIAAQRWKQDEQRLCQLRQQQILQNAEANARLRQKSFVEQQTVLNLLDMGRSNEGIAENIEHSLDPVSELVNHLVADAPDNVTEMIVKTEAEQLEQLKKMIDARLSALHSSTHGATLLSGEKELVETPRSRQSSRSRTSTRKYPYDRPSSQTRQNATPSTKTNLKSFKQNGRHDLDPANDTPHSRRSLGRSASPVQKTTNGRTTQTNSPLAHTNGLQDEDAMEL